MLTASFGFQQSVRLNAHTLLYSGKSHDGSHLIVSAFQISFNKFKPVTMLLFNRKVHSICTKNCLCVLPTVSSGSDLCHLLLAVIQLS